MTKDWKELRKTIFGIIGSNEYLQPDMIIDHKGLMWRFNQDWLNQVTNNVIEALESNFVPKPRTLNKLIYLIFIIFSLAMLLSIYYGIKDEIEAVEGLREYLR